MASTVAVNEGARLLTDEARRVGRMMGDRFLIVTVWTCRRVPSVEEREQLHEEMQRALGAGFVGSIGWER